jgi:hypothetical protein
MTTSFIVTAKGAPDYFRDNVSKGDADTYSFDFTPWQEANHTITSATWTVESGNASVSGKVLASGVASALVTFTDPGRSLISILATTATEKKKAWLEVVAKDQSVCVDDYGFVA